MGPTAEEVVDTNDQEIVKKRGFIDKLKERLKFHKDKPLKTPEEENQIEILERTIEEEQQDMDDLERENEEIQERMSWRDRVRDIF